MISLVSFLLVDPMPFTSEHLGRVTISDHPDTKFQDKYKSDILHKTFQITFKIESPETFHLIYFTDTIQLAGKTSNKE